MKETRGIEIPRDAPYRILREMAASLHGRVAEDIRAQYRSRPDYPVFVAVAPGRAVIYGPHEDPKLPEDARIIGECPKPWEDHSWLTVWVARNVTGIMDLCPRR